MQSAQKPILCVIVRTIWGNFPTFCRTMNVLEWNVLKETPTPTEYTCMSYAICRMHTHNWTVLYSYVWASTSWSVAFSFTIVLLLLCRSASVCIYTKYICLTKLTNGEYVQRFEIYTKIIVVCFFLFISKKKFSIFLAYERYFLLFFFKSWHKA